MRPLHVPALFCPEKARMAPNVNDAVTQVNDWLRQFPLADEVALERYQSECFVHMTARFYPNIDLARLVILSEFYTLLFISDDQLDHQDNFKDKDFWRSFVSEFMAVVTKDRYYSMEDGNPALAALSDLWQRMKQLSTPQWRQQFIESLYDMYKAAFWENENISGSKGISLIQYMQQRQFLGAANIATDGIGFAYPAIQLSVEERADPTLQRLTELCRNTICWANDLFSLGKELEHGGTHNLVLLIRDEYNISLNAATQRTVAIHDHEVQQFYYLWRDVISAEERDNPLINAYIEALADLMAGNIYWSVIDTDRYYGFSYAKSRVVKMPLLATAH